MKVTKTLNKAALDALDSALLIVSAPRDASYQVVINKVTIKKEGTQIAGSSSNLTFRYVGDTTALVTFSAINAANGVLNSTVTATQSRYPNAANAIAASVSVGVGVECILSADITANADNIVTVVVDFDLIKL